MEVSAELKRERVRQMSARVDIFRRAYPAAARAAVVRVADELMQAAVDNAPEATGFLRRSAYVTPGRAKTVFGFGAWYATVLNGRANIKLKKRGRPRFFSVTLEEAFPTLLKRLASRAESNIKAGITEVVSRFPIAPPEGNGYRGKKGPRKSTFSLSRREGGFARKRKPRGQRKAPRKPA